MTELCVSGEESHLDRLSMAQLTQLFLTSVLECPFYKVRAWPWTVWPYFLMGPVSLKFLYLRSLSVPSLKSRTFPDLVLVAARQAFLWSVGRITVPCPRKTSRLPGRSHQTLQARTPGLLRLLQGFSTSCSSGYQSVNLWTEQILDYFSVYFKPCQKFHSSLERASGGLSPWISHAYVGLEIASPVLPVPCLVLHTLNTILESLTWGIMNKDGKTPLFSLKIA